MNYVISKNIEIYPYGKKANVFNKDNKKMYVIGENELKVLMLLDGNHSIEQIAEECYIYSKEDIQELIKLFDSIGIFGKKSKKNNILKMQFKIFNPNKIFGSEKKITFILSYIIFLFPLIFFLGIVLNSMRSNGIIESGVTNNIILQKYLNMNVGQYVIIIFVSYISLIVHELGHTIIAKHYKVNVPEIGIMLYLFIPVAYSNVSCSNLLHSKKKRFLILSAGIFCDLGVIGISYILLCFANDYYIGCILYGIITLHYVQIAINFLIFVKYDGYYMMEILISESNFSENANIYLKKLCSDILKKGKNKELIIDSKEEQLNHSLYFLYKIASIVFIPIFLLSFLFLH